MSTVEGDGGALAALHLEDVASNKDWAELMQEEQEPFAHQPVTEPDPEPDFPPPFVAIVEDLPHEASEEDVFYYFGGDEHVKELDYKEKEGRARFEFFTAIGLQNALAFNGDAYLNKVIKVSREVPRASNDVRMGSGMAASGMGYNRPPRGPPQQSYQRREGGGNYEGRDRGGGNYDGRDRGGGNYDGRDRGGGSYGGRDYRHDSGAYNQYNRNHNYDQRRGGGYGNSQGGYSNQAYSGGIRDGPTRGSGGQGYSNRRPSDDTFYERGISYDQGYGRGGHNNRGGYGARGGPGPILRSGSYANHNEEPRAGTISRARTESTSSQNQSERRPIHLAPRHPDSALISPSESMNAVAVKKPSKKDIFGDAKPVDTNAKLMETEIRLLKEKKEREERKAAEAKKEADDKEREERERERMKESEQPTPPPAPVQILRRTTSSVKDEAESVPAGYVTDSTLRESIQQKKKPEQAVYRPGNNNNNREQRPSMDNRGKGGKPYPRTFTNSSVPRTGTPKNMPPNTGDTDSVRSGSQGGGSTRGGRGARGGRGGRGGNRGGRGAHQGDRQSGNTGRTDEERTEKEEGNEQRRRDSVDERRSAPPAVGTLPVAESAPSSTAIPLPAGANTESAKKKKNKKGGEKESEANKAEDKKDAKSATPKKKKKDNKPLFATGNRFEALNEV